VIELDPEAVGELLWRWLAGPLPREKILDECRWEDDGGALTWSTGCEGLEHTFHHINEGVSPAWRTECVTDPK
jgi:hypothetical protein